MALTFSVNSMTAFAEAPASSSATANTSEIVSHLEKAQIEVGKSDFSNAQIHLKAARAASEHIAGGSEAAKQAHAALIQSQIKAKLGDVSGATEQLNKTIALYKSL
ncbi:MAG: hypothetical protein PHW13_03355 [Methylococcales bacterium]|nr:hypothetical protein [Methylococcales bacterium]